MYHQSNFFPLNIFLIQKLYVKFWTNLVLAFAWSACSQDIFKFSFFLTRSKGSSEYLLDRKD